MTCCVIGLLILAIVGRFRRAVGRAEAPALFAPVAQRPVPGQTLVAPMPAEPEPPQGSAAVFRYAASALALCLVAMPVLVWAGLLENTGSLGMWLLRVACYLALIAVAVVLSRSLAGLRNARGTGWRLLVTGAVLFEAGVMDMHVFGVIKVEHGNSLADIIFHNVGPVLAVIGALVLVTGAVSRRNALVSAQR